MWKFVLSSHKENLNQASAFFSERIYALKYEHVKKDICRCISSIQLRITFRITFYKELLFQPDLIQRINEN